MTSSKNKLDGNYLRVAKETPHGRPIGELAKYLASNSTLDQVRVKYSDGAVETASSDFFTNLDPVDVDERNKRMGKNGSMNAEEAHRITTEKWAQWISLVEKNIAAKMADNDDGSFHHIVTPDSGHNKEAVEALKDHFTALGYVVTTTIKPLILGVCNGGLECTISWQLGLNHTAGAIAGMTNDERLELFSLYCVHCGDNDPRCPCWNDE